MPSRFELGRPFVAAAVKARRACLRHTYDFCVPFPRWRCTARCNVQLNISWDVLQQAPLAGDKHDRRPAGGTASCGEASGRAPASLRFRLSAPRQRPCIYIQRLSGIALVVCSFAPRSVTAWFDSPRASTGRVRASVLRRQRFQRLPWRPHATTSQRIRDQNAPLSTGRGPLAPGQSVLFRGARRHV